MEKPKLILEIPCVVFPYDSPSKVKTENKAGDRKFI